MSARLRLVARSAAPQIRRALASVASGAPPTLGSQALGPFQVFDRHAKVLQRDRAAARDGGARSRQVDYVREEVAERMIDRLLDIKRKFNTILDLGSGAGHFTKLIERETTGKVVMLDSSKQMLHRDPDEEFEVDIERIHGDEEHLLEIVGRETQDAIVSCMSLHWINDLPGVLVQAKEALKPDGVFLGAILGGDTLFELRTSLQLAEMDREGGISPHVSPMTGTSDITNLLGRAGFTLTTIDTDEVKVAYPSMWELLEDLQDMGESNAVMNRRHIIQRDTLAAASAIYKEMHGNEDGSIPATFQVIYFIGWKPSPDQPKPLPRGSGETNLKDIL